jgi:hypothetical protein
MAADNVVTFGAATTVHAQASPPDTKRSHPSTPLAWVTYIFAPACKAFLNEGWRRIRLQPYIRTFVKLSRLLSLMEFAGREYVLK